MSSSPSQSLVPSLSDLAVELLDDILYWLHISWDGYKPLRKLLFVNKRIGSMAVKRLYQCPANYRPYWEYKGARLLFDTLLSSANGTTYFPCHFYIKELPSNRLFSIMPSTMCTGDTQKVWGKILECKQLRSLSLSVPRDVLLLEAIPECDIAFLEVLALSIKEDLKDAKALAWMKSMTSRMRLKSLEIIMESPCSMEFLDLPRNTLSSVSMKNFWNGGLIQGFTQTFLSSQSQSLESLSASHVNFLIGSPLSLPNLRTIRIENSQVFGWEHLCGSLTSLKNLCFENVALSGTPPFVPDPKQLETLGLAMKKESVDVAATWLDRNSKSFSSLRTLRVHRLFLGTLTCILNNCPNLTELTSVYPFDEDIEAVSQSAASLRSLILIDGRLTSDGIFAFARAFPPSITRLEISESCGVTPSTLRLLMELPSLRYLSLRSIYTEFDDIEELQEIAEYEQPLGLEFDWEFID